MSVKAVQGMLTLMRLHVRSAVTAVFRHNFRPDLSRHESVQRAYALGDEGGLVTASWPHGGRPHVPFIYSVRQWQIKASTEP
jgi:hypothetical protein